ncbi:MAG: Holliday junction branch migration protein RuvA [Clostridiales bacterium]|nr:Holliday junction branch migration protein RuvA [Clostridiales bacterium]
MIAIVKGTVVEKGQSEVVIMTANGMGLRLLCSMNTIAALPASAGECMLYTHMNIREDAMELFGFLKKEERDMFQKLISVSGIGPKSAILMLGSMPISELRLAILTGDIAMLTRAPGVGKKTAQRITLELKDKLTQDALTSGLSLDELSYIDTGEAPATDAISEAMQALKTLGYTPKEAADALKGVRGKAETTDELIKLALRHMVQQG